MIKIGKKKDKKDKKDKKPRVVTQANLEESRDEVLTKGKKFRYPFQYAKHRLIFNAILIGLVALLTFSIVGYVQLYKANNTGEVMYRFTRTIPMSVAEVDGKKVRFSDYLMLYRSSVTSIERQQGEFDDSEDAKSQLAYYRRQALNSAEDYSFALAKLAEMGESVTQEEIDEVVNRHRSIDGELRSEDSFAGIVENNFGLSLKEYRRMIELSLAKKKYSEKTDTKASELMTEIKTQIANNDNNMAAMAELYGNNELFSYEKIEGVEVGNLDGGRAKVAVALKNVGDISEVFSSTNGDGYYIVKLLAKDDNSVSYESIWVRFSMFDEEMQKLRDDGKVVEKITLE